MKRSITKSLNKRIEQSSQSILSLFRKAVIAIGVVAAFGIVLVAFTSCNVTRTITNQSQYYQRGDTSVVITTKTIETYDATKKL